MRGWGPGWTLDNLDRGEGVASPFPRGVAVDTRAWVWGRIRSNFGGVDYPLSMSVFLVALAVLGCARRVVECVSAPSFVCNLHSPHRGFRCCATLFSTVRGTLSLPFNINGVDVVGDRNIQKSYPQPAACWSYAMETAQPGPPLGAQRAGRLAKSEEKNGAVCTPGRIQQARSAAVVPDLDVQACSGA